MAANRYQFFVCKSDLFGMRVRKKNWKLLLISGILLQNVLKVFTNSRINHEKLCSARIALHFFILVTETNDWYCYLNNAAAPLNGDLNLLWARVARNTPASDIFGSVYLFIEHENKSIKIKIQNDKYTSMSLFSSHIRFCLPVVNSATKKQKAKVYEIPNVFNKSINSYCSKRRTMWSKRLKNMYLAI